MDGSKLSLTALKDKVTAKLSLDPKASLKKGKVPGGKKSGAKNGKKTSRETTREKGSQKLEEQQAIKPADSNTSEDSILRKEAYALGASEEDIKMLEGLDEEESEAEFDDEPVDKSLASEVSDFIKGLGFLGEIEIVDEKDAKQDIHEEEPEVTEEVHDVVPKVSKKTVFDDEETKVKPQEKEPSKNSKKEYEINSVNSDKLQIEPRVDWYNADLVRPEAGEKLDKFALERLTDKAKAFTDSENKTYLEEFASNNSQKRFLFQVLSDGTLNDKISALTLLVQEAPFHNIKAFDTLLFYCEKKSRTAALQAIDAMKDLLLNGLLPDRKLVSFAKQPLAKDLDERTLGLYYFEDHLKKSYFKFIQVLEYLTHDPILHVRMKVLTHIFDLLKAKPEQEANLLRLGVNKLGDNDNKVAAKTSYQILQLEQAHPAMKKIVTDAITDLILQKKDDYHSRYYTVLTLNQTILTRKEIDLANALVKTYFSLFEKILVEADPALREKKDDKTLGNVERGRKNNRKSFKKGKKGGRSVKQEEKSEEEVIEEKSAKMFSALLTGLNRAFPFADLPSDIYLSHLDTLYKITHSTNFNTSVQALVLVQHIVSQQDLDSDRYYRTLYESLLDPRLVNSSKQGVYLNLLFKSLKNDIQNVPRILAFVKRILQVCAHWINVGATAGMIYLLMELSKTHPQILELMETEAGRPEGASAANDENAEYDPLKRNPVYAHADKSCLWEIAQFVHHYHPTISIYAESFVQGQSQPKPDLGLFTLAHFLDRFVYKNAKQKNATKGSSIMQPLGGAQSGSLLMKATNVNSTSVPVNTIDWLSKRADQVSPHEKFFHQYFSGNERKIKNKRVKKKDGDDDEPEMDEEEVWDALVKLKPDVEGSDEDLSDLDEEDFSGMSDLDDGEEIEEVDGQFDESEDDAEAFGGADDDLMGSDGEEFNFNEEDEYSSGDEPALAGEKRSREDDGKDKKKRVKLLSLPVFASVDDYSEMLQSDDE